MPKYDNRVSKYKKKIDIKLESERFYSGAYYDKNKAVVEIQLRKQPVDVYQTLNFVHELGHALDMLEIVDKGKNPHKLPKYSQELKADKFTHKFIKRHISDEHQKVIRYNELQMITSTLFEIDIFTNDQQDFDKAYARAINRCYPMTHQTKNPFYVLYKRFVFRPMGELMSSMTEVELYLKEASKVG